MFTEFDRLEDLGTDVIELNIKNPERRKNAKITLKSAREKAERLYNENHRNFN